VSRGPLTDNQPFQQSTSLMSNSLTPLTPSTSFATGSCSTPLPTTLKRCQNDTKDGEANRIAGMSRGQLEQYLLSRQLPTSGTRQQLRERALLCLEEGILQQIPKQSTEQLQARNGKKWWITRSGNYQSTLFIDLRQFIKTDGFNFLQNEGVIITNPNDWTDEELWETVWEYMIPHTGSESEPNEDGRFLHTCHLFP
jgi:hypothetical protein